MADYGASLTFEGENLIFSTFSPIKIRKIDIFVLLRLQ